MPLGAILAQGREASGLACWGRVVVALRLGSRTDVLSLQPRAQVDARNHLDFISLSPYHEADMKTEHTVLRYIFQARMCAWCRGRRVWGGAENARFDNCACPVTCG